MVDKKKLIRVVNRENSKVGYKIPELGNLRRQFEPGETKEIEMDELIKLSYMPGGKVMMSEYLIIMDEEAVKELIGDVEPEYYYKEKDIKDLLLNGTLEELKDCLDFAPQGVLDHIKSVAVKIEINDLQKRKAIQEALGFNVTGAIDVVHAYQEDQPEEIKPKRRRATTSDTTGVLEKKRRTTPKYTYGK